MYAPTQGIKFAKLLNDLIRDVLLSNLEHMHVNPYYDIGMYNACIILHAYVLQKVMCFNLFFILASTA